MNKTYWDSYKILQEVFAKKNILFKRVSYHHYENTDDGLFFTKTAILENDGFHILEDRFKADLLWNRISEGNVYLSELSAGTDIVSSFRLQGIAADKYSTYLYTKEFHPNTSLLYQFMNSEEIYNSFTEDVVLKPINAFGGSGIEFLKKEKLLERSDLSAFGKTYIVQDYIDFSKGAPDISDGNHDVRLIFFGKKLKYGVVRIPKTGSLKSNLHAGGSIKYLSIENIPNDLIDLSKVIQEGLLIQKNDYYSLDYGYSYDDGKWYLIEINTSPGFTFPKDKKNEQINFFNGLADFFLEQMRD